MVGGFFMKVGRSLSFNQRNELLEYLTIFNFLKY